MRDVCDFIYNLSPQGDRADKDNRTQSATKGREEKPTVNTAAAGAAT